MLVNIIGAAPHTKTVTFLTPLTLDAQHVFEHFTFEKLRKPLTIRLKLLKISSFSHLIGIRCPKKPFLSLFSHTYLPWHFPSEVLEMTARFT